MEQCYGDPRPGHNVSGPLLAALSSFKASYETVHGWVCLVICGFGVVTNLIHMAVLTSKSMRNSAVNVILTAIAACDAGTMLSYLIYLWHFGLGSADHRVRYCSDSGSFMSFAWMVFLMVHICVSIALHTSSLWLAVVMAFVRLMTLRQGSLSSGWQKPGTAWVLSGSVYAVILLLCIPTIVCHEIQEFPRQWWYMTCEPNTTEAQWANDSSYAVYTIDTSTVALADDCRLYKANLWLTGVMFKFVPCVFLVLLSTSLLLRISAAERNRARLMGLASSGGGATRRRRRSVDNTTLMLLAILLLFLITELPQGAVAIVNAAFLSDLTTSIYHNVADFLDLLSLINSSVNFILYCVMSSRYRQTFWKVVCPAGAYSCIFSRAKRLGLMSEGASGFRTTCRPSPSRFVSTKEAPSPEPPSIQASKALGTSARGFLSPQLRGGQAVKKLSLQLTAAEVAGIRPAISITRTTKTKSLRLGRFLRPASLVSSGAPALREEEKLIGARRTPSNDYVCRPPRSDSLRPPSPPSDEEVIML